MTVLYILDDEGNPIMEPDRDKWARWFIQAERHVADEQIGESRISTVFRGIDDRFGDGSPVLWETMVFGGPLDQEQDRCSGTRKEALAMHARMVKRVRAAMAV